MCPDFLLISLRSIWGPSAQPTYCMVIATCSHPTHRPASFFAHDQLQLVPQHGVSRRSSAPLWWASPPHQCQSETCRSGSAAPGVGGPKEQRPAPCVLRAGIVGQRPGALFFGRVYGQRCRVWHAHAARLYYYCDAGIVNAMAADGPADNKQGLRDRSYWHSASPVISLFFGKCLLSASTLLSMFYGEPRRSMSGINHYRYWRKELKVLWFRLFFGNLM